MCCVNSHEACFFQLNSRCGQGRDLLFYSERFYQQNSIFTVHALGYSYSLGMEHVPNKLPDFKELIFQWRYIYPVGHYLTVGVTLQRGYYPSSWLVVQSLASLFCQFFSVSVFFLTKHFKKEIIHFSKAVGSWSTHKIQVWLDDLGICSGN